jgi:uncharacterized protein (TIGR00661 family)
MDRTEYAGLFLTNQVEGKDATGRIPTLAKIFYSMAGEGRGHAVRARVLAELLRHDHDLTLFAPGDAYHLLNPLFHGSDVRVIRIPGLRFKYANGRLSFLKTAKAAAEFLWHLPRLLKRLERVISRSSPDLVITDFEPSLPRAAQRCGVPFISLNHQHFLVANDLSKLPIPLRRRASLMGMIVGAYYSGQQETIVSSFYSPPLKPFYRNVTQIGVLLRPQILKACKERGKHLLAYIRKDALPNVIHAFRRCGRPVKVYGLGKLPDEDSVQFCEVNEVAFVEDLATCEAVITTAGNQLVGESLYLEKPVLAMPESNNFEQFINGFFLEQSGTGSTVPLERVTAEDIIRFLARGDEFRALINPEKLNGNEQALASIQRNLPKGINASSSTIQSCCIAQTFMRGTV